MKIPRTPWHVRTGSGLKPRDHLVQETPHQSPGQAGIALDSYLAEIHKNECIVLYLKSQTPNYMSTG